MSIAAHRYLLSRSAFAAGFCAVLMAGCGGGGGSTPAAGSVTPPLPDPPPPPVASAAPAITAQPASQTVTAGAPATLSVAGSGGALSYQWTRNGAELAGATAASYTLPALQPADSAAVWRVQVRNSLGSVTSQPVMLTVGGAGMRPLAGLVGEKIDSAALYTFNSPFGITGDGKGGFYVMGSAAIYRVSAGGQVSVAASDLHCIFRQGALDKNGILFVPCQHAIYQLTQEGVLSLVAGSRDVSGTNDGVGAAARFNNPSALAFDSKGMLYASDGVSLIRKIDTDGRVTSFVGNTSYTGVAVDGTGAAASFSVLKGIAFDAQDLLYVLDMSTLRTVTPAGVVTTVSGQAGWNGAGWVDGPLADARFNYAWGLTIDAAGVIYIADTNNQVIRKISRDGQVSTLAGNHVQAGSADGVGMLAAFNAPFAVTVGGDGNLYVADTFNNTVRKVTMAGAVSTLAGEPTLPRSSGSVDGMGQEARFFRPTAMTVDGAGNLLVSDTGNYIVRKISPAGTTSRLAGRPDNHYAYDGSGYGVGFQGPDDLVVDRAGNIYVLDKAQGDSVAIVGKLRKLTPDGAVTTVALPSDPLNVMYPTGTQEVPALPSALAADAAGNLYVSARAFDSSPFCSPHIPCYYMSRTAIRKIGADGTAVTLAATPNGITPGTLPENVGVQGLAVDAAGNVYLADTPGNRILKIAANGAVTTLAGGSQGAADGNGSAASFSGPTRLAVDAAGNVYVVDSGNITVRRITPDGTVSTLAGTAGKNQLAMDTLPGSLSTIGGIALDAAGNLYISLANGVIRIAKP